MLFDFLILQVFCNAKYAHYNYTPIGKTYKYIEILDQKSSFGF